MKQRVVTICLVLVSMGVFLGLAPRAFENTGLAWLNWDSLLGRHSFYFKQRQWLADARTVVAGFEFLLEFRRTNQGYDAQNIAKSPASPAKPASTNRFPEIADTGVSNEVSHARPYFGFRSYFPLGKIVLIKAPGRGSSAQLELQSTQSESGMATAVGT
jgi:hypothetical protein